MSFGNDDAAKDLEKQLDEQVQEQNAQIQEKVQSIAQERIRIIKSQDSSQTWYNPTSVTNPKVQTNKGM